MTLPSQPVTFSVEQVDELNRKLADTRHDINNHLMLITAAIELMHRKPAANEQYMEIMKRKPGEIRDLLYKFSGEFERAFGITRP